MAINFNSVFDEDQQEVDQQPQPKTMQELFKEYNPEPKQIDERKLAMAKNISGVGEGLMLLGQIAGARRGARINPMQLPSPAEAVQSREDALRSIYEKRSTDYRTGLMSSAQQDILRAEAAKKERIASDRYDREFKEGQKRYENQQTDAFLDRMDRKAREVKDDENRKQQLNIQLEQIRLSKQNAQLAMQERGEAADYARQTKELALNIKSNAAKAKADSEFLARNADRVYIVKPMSFANAPAAKMIDDDALAYLYYADKNNGADIFESSVSTTTGNDNRIKSPWIKK